MTETRAITVAANGLGFEALEAGAGDRLALLLHGFPEHAISWRHQIPVLAALVIMNVPHPLRFRAALRHARQLRRS